MSQASSTATTTSATLAPSSASSTSSTIRTSVSASHNIVDTRIARLRPLIPPAVLLEELPSPASTAAFIHNSRQQAASIIHQQDDRLIVVVGPCSIHDVKAALDYAHRLAPLAQKYADTLYIAMRVYFEKPRTTVGWKGLINDPTLDGSFQINNGLRIARKLLLDINALALPIACEMLDTITPQFIGDLMSWGAIGARTTESQLHRELVSGLSMPIGFKNGTTGNVKIATDAIVAARSPHSFLSVTTQGLAAIVETVGNADCHLVLRGSDTGPNYTAYHISESEKLLKSAKIPISIMVDCSHGNSNKDHKNQAEVVLAICTQLSNSHTDSIMGVMIESNIVAGSQQLKFGSASNKDSLVYGQSITDACVGWDQTVTLLEQLSQAVKARRLAKKQ